jgi:hypothetical protein
MEGIWRVMNVRLGRLTGLLKKEREGRKEGREK